MKRVTSLIGASSIFILLMLSVQVLFAQIPGYQGMRFSLMYNIGVSPALRGALQNYYPVLHHNVSAEYVVGRRKSIGIRYCRTDLKSNYEGQSAVFADNYQYDQTYIGNKLSSSSTKFNSNAISVYAKFFNGRGTLAPRGGYLIAGLSYFYSVAQVPNYATIDYTTVSTPARIDIYKKTRHDVGLMLGIGTNVMVIRRLFVNVGFEFNIPLNTLPWIIDYSGGGSFVEFNDEMKNIAVRNSLAANVMQLHVGLGFLPF
jgi:hypothetical protein